MTPHLLGEESFSQSPLLIPGINRLAPSAVPSFPLSPNAAIIRRGLTPREHTANLPKARPGRSRLLCLGAVLRQGKESSALAPSATGETRVRSMPFLGITLTEASRVRAPTGRSGQPPLNHGSRRLPEVT
jgi:hypothetical protein